MIMRMKNCTFGERQMIQMEYQEDTAEDKCGKVFYLDRTGENEYTIFIRCSGLVESHAMYIEEACTQYGR